MEKTEIKTIGVILSVMILLNLTQAELDSIGGDLCQRSVCSNVHSINLVLKSVNHTVVIKYLLILLTIVSTIAA